VWHGGNEKGKRKNEKGRRVISIVPTWVVGRFPFTG